MAWNSRACLHLFQKIITLCLFCICHLRASSDTLWFLSWKPSNVHSAVTFLLAHHFRDIYCTPSAICLSALKIPTQFCLSSQESCSRIQEPTLHSSLNPAMLYSLYTIFHTQCVEGMYFGIMTFSTMLSPLFLIMYLPLFITTEHKADAFMKHLFKEQFPK